MTSSPSHALLGRGTETDNSKLRLIKKYIYLAPVGICCIFNSSLVCPLYSTGQEVGRLGVDWGGAGRAQSAQGGGFAPAETFAHRQSCLPCRMGP